MGILRSIKSLFAVPGRPNPSEQLYAAIADTGQRSEWVIAVCRLALSISALAIIFLDPRQPLYGSSALYGVLVSFITYSAALLWLVANQRLHAARAAKPILFADIAWFTAIVALSEGGPSPFFLFYVFAVGSAGARWGMRTTVRVAIGSAVLYLVSVLGIRWLLFGPDFVIRSAHILRPTYLVILGYLIGFIGEHELSAKERLKEIVAVQQEVSNRASELATVARLLGRIVRFFVADYALLQVRQADGSGLEWEGSAKAGAVPILHPVPDRAWTPASSGKVAYRLTHALGNWGRRVEMIDLEKGHSRSIGEDDEPGFLARVRTRSLISIPISTPEGARGRLVLGRSRRNFSVDETYFCRTLVNQGIMIHQSLKLQQNSEDLAVAEERARIARDIHDGFVQSLASLDVGIEICRKLKERDPEQLDEEFQDLQRNVKQGYREARQYLDRLRDRSARGADVDTAMESIIRAFREKTEANIEFHCHAGGIPAQHGVGFEVLQIVREGLTNICRHAEASHASVSVDASERDLVVVIRDDGVGFPAATPPPWSIRERVESLSGDLRIRSEIGAGTEIRIKLPRNGTRLP